MGVRIPLQSPGSLTLNHPPQNVRITSLASCPATVCTDGSSGPNCMCAGRTCAECVVVGGGYGPDNPNGGSTSEHLRGSSHYCAWNATANVCSTGATTTCGSRRRELWEETEDEIEADARELASKFAGQTAYTTWGLSTFNFELIDGHAACKCGSPTGTRTHSPTATKSPTGTPSPSTGSGCATKTTCDACTGNCDDRCQWIAGSSTCAYSPSTCTTNCNPTRQLDALFGAAEQGVVARGLTGLTYCFGLTACPTGSPTATVTSSPTNTATASVTPSTSPPPSSPWGLFGHDANNTRRSPYLGYRYNTTKWVAILNGKIYATPAIDSAGTSYVPVWGFGTTSSLPVGYDAPNDWELFALNGTTGSIIWFVHTGEASASPVLWGGKVYLAQLSGKITAYSTATGTKLWDSKVATYSKPVSSSFAFNSSFWATPTITTGGVMYAPFFSGDTTTPCSSISDCKTVGGYASGGLFAVNAATGSTLWTYNASWAGGALTSPIVRGEGTVYLLCNWYLLAFAPAGTVQWYADVKTGSNYYWYASSPVLSPSGLLYGSSIYGNMIAVDAGNPTLVTGSTIPGLAVSPQKNTNLLWAVAPLCSFSLLANGGADHYATYKVDNSYPARLNRQYSSPALTSDGDIVIGCLSNVLRVNGATGSVVWKVPLDGMCASCSPVLDRDNVVYVTTYNGTGQSSQAYSVTVMAGTTTAAPTVRPVASSAPHAPNPRPQA